MSFRDRGGSVDLTSLFTKFITHRFFLVKCSKRHSIQRAAKTIFDLRRVISEKFVVGSVVDWLKRRVHDHRSLGSKPTRAILLCLWGRHFTALFPCLVVLASSFKLKSYFYHIASGQQYLGISGSRWR